MEPLKKPIQFEARSINERSIYEIEHEIALNLPPLSLDEINAINEEALKGIERRRLWREKYGHLATKQ